LGNEKHFGTIKWFSNEKGRGLITDPQNCDYCFDIRDVIGARIPKPGEQVTFEGVSGEKGLSARDIEIAQATTPEQTGSKDVKLDCWSCKSRVVPRLVFDRGMISYSACPICASMLEDFDPNRKKRAYVTTGIILSIVAFIFIYIDILPALKRGDSLYRTAMSDRKNVLGRVNVAVAI